MADYDLAALLCSRLSHDLTGPVGAVANGVELLAEDEDPAMQAQSLELLAFSAAEVSRRLQFYRLAFGAAGGLEATTTIGEGQRTAANFFTDRKQELDWPAGPVDQEAMPQAAIQLLLNLVLLGGEALPRGGGVSVEIVKKGMTTNFTITASGPQAGLRADDLAALRTESAVQDLDARTVQPYFAARLAASLSGKIDVATPETDRIVILSQILTRK